MTPARMLVLVAALAASLAGLAFKTHRYASQFDEPDTANMGTLATFMATQGWTPVPAAAAGGYPFTYIRFAKAGCPRPLVVATLGRDRELADDVRLALGPDVGFIERIPGGEPNGKVGLAGRLTHWLAPPELLAVAPAPREHGGECSGPSLADWSGA